MMTRETLQTDSTHTFFVSNAILPHVAQGFDQLVDVQEAGPVFVEAGEHALELRRAVPVFRHFVEGFVHRGHELLNTIETRNME
jgi:hypothetical protein